MSGISRLSVVWWSPRVALAPQCAPRRPAGTWGRSMDRWRGCDESEAFNGRGLFMGFAHRTHRLAALCPPVVGDQVAPLFDDLGQVFMDLGMVIPAQGHELGVVFPGNE